MRSHLSIAYGTFLYIETEFIFVENVEANTFRTIKLHKKYSKNNNANEQRRQRRVFIICNEYRVRVNNVINDKKPPSVIQK